MSKCKNFQNQFIDALYSELDAGSQKQFDTHLQNCASCSAEYQQFAAALKMMDQRKLPDPGEAFWENYWENLESKLVPETTPEEESKPKIIRGFFKKFAGGSEGQWVYRISAAAAILLIGIFIGKFLFTGSGLERPSVPFTEAPGQFIQRAAVNERTQQYFDKSKVLILGLVNLEPELMRQDEFDFSRYQQVSQTLVKEAAVLKGELNDPKQQRLRKLVSDLEVILLQIANLEMENDLSAIEMVKDGVDRRGVLLKINLEEIRKQATQAQEKSEDTVL